MELFRVFSNMAYKCESNSFEGIDAETQEAIIYNVASFLGVSTTDAESLVSTLYYETYTDNKELMVRYRIPVFVERKCLYE